MTDPQPSREDANRYMAYSEVCGKVTTEENCPSLKTMLNPSGDDEPQPCKMTKETIRDFVKCTECMQPRYKHIFNIMYFFCWMTQIWFMILILCFWNQSAVYHTLSNVVMLFCYTIGSQGHSQGWALMHVLISSIIT